MERFFPFLVWLKGYKKEYFTKDFIAGLTVSAVFIPQAMAYALIAGLPPIYGLYAASVPLIVAALWQSIPQIHVGPVAITAFLTYSALISYVSSESPDYINYAILLAFIVGVLRLAIGLFKLSFILRFISNSVVSAYASAGAIIIISTQIPTILGIKVEQKQFIFESFYEIAKNVIHTNPQTLLVGIASIALIVGIRKINKALPSALITVVVMTFASYWFNFEALGIKVVGHIPSGFPSFALPDLTKTDFIFYVLGKASIIAVVGFMESYTMSKIIAQKTKQRVNTDQELIAQGLANIVGSFFKSFPVSGSFSRSALNFQAGAVTSMANIVSASFVILTLLFLAPLLYYLPRATLAAVVMTAVVNLIKPPSYYKEVWKVNKYDSIAAITTFVFTFLTRPDYSIFLGVFLSLVLFLWRSLYPRIVLLSRDPRSKTFVNAQTFQIPECPQIAMVRPEAPLYYANVENIVEELRDMIQQRPALKHFVIDGEAINYADSTAVDVLRDFAEEAKKNGVNIGFVNLKGPVYETLLRGGLTELIGEENILPSKGYAVDVLFDRIDHNYCKEQCPYAVFDECYTVKEYIRFMPVEEDFVHRLHALLYLKGCEVFYGKIGNLIRVECEDLSLELRSEDFAKDEKGRVYLKPSGVVKLRDEFRTFGYLARSAGLEFVNGYILLSKGGTLEEVAQNLAQLYGKADEPLPVHKP